ncbi:MAG: 16S rRNA (guanine(966)-N(2))-methyltransferase RsmD [Lachnospiraceae bacterium]|nr:16S rRNA (guanine(966)-N(2))-methyltransferase RsmD [Lachnospiraceae bacterium]
MQVIAGTARRILLKTLPGDHTRPTSDRVKETLFNILQPRIPGCRFLDLFAGCGGIAIEALSRGAKEAVLVDNNRRACEIIRENLAWTHLAEKALLWQTDAAAAVKRLTDRGERFDIIFLDPPYDGGWEMLVLPLLAQSSLLAPEGLIVLETRVQRELPELEQWGLVLEREKKYKNNKHMFIRLKEKEDE